MKNRAIGVCGQTDAAINTTTGRRANSMARKIRPVMVDTAKALQMDAAERPIAINGIKPAEGRKTSRKIRSSELTSSKVGQI